MDAIRADSYMKSEGKMGKSKSTQELSALSRERDRLRVEMLAMIRRELVTPDIHVQSAAAVETWNTLQAELDELEKLISFVQQQLEPEEMDRADIRIRQWTNS